MFNINKTQQFIILILNTRYFYLSTKILTLILLNIQNNKKTKIEHK